MKKVLLSLIVFQSFSLPTSLMAKEYTCPTEEEFNGYLKEFAKEKSKDENLYRDTQYMFFPEKNMIIFSEIRNFQNTLTNNWIYQFAQFTPLNDLERLQKKFNQSPAALINGDSFNFTAENVKMFSCTRKPKSLRMFTIDFVVPEACQFSDPSKANEDGIIDCSSSSEDCKIVCPD